MNIRINPHYFLEVSTNDFCKTVLTITRKSKKKDPGNFIMSYSEGLLICRGLDDTVPIVAKGDWANPIAVSPLLMKKIPKSLPDTPIIRLGFLNDRFYIDNFSIPAVIVSS